MKRMLLIFGSVIVCCGLNATVTFAESQTPNEEGKHPEALAYSDIFSRLGSAGDIRSLIEFYFNASYKTDIDAALQAMVKELVKKGYVLKLASEDARIRIGGAGYDLGKYTRAYRYATSDGNIWLDVVIYGSGERFKANLNQTFTGHASFSDPNRSCWIFHTCESSRDNAVSAFFRSKSRVINIGVSLPLALGLSALRDLPQADLRRLNARIDTLYDVTRSVVENLVCREDLVMMPPLPGEGPTAAQRVAAFVLFWSEVKYNFAFFDQVPDLDWDKALHLYLPEVMREQTSVEHYRLLQRIAALLRDAHTKILPPGYVERAFDKPGIRLRNVKRRAIVVNVGRSLEKRLPLGSQIVAVDGVPTKAYLEKEIFPYISSSTDHLLWDWGVRDLLKGPRDTEVTLTFRTMEGDAGELKVGRNSRKQIEDWIRKESGRRPRLEFKRLEGDIAYVALNGFGNEGIVKDFEKHLPALRKCRGLIIDIRKNPGGSSGNGYAIIKHLTDKPFLGSRWKTREHRAAFKAWGQFRSRLTPEQLSQLSPQELERTRKEMAYYEGTAWHEGEPQTIQPHEGDTIAAPVVVLIGHGTASAAEDFLIALDSIERATFVGQKTGGSTGQPLHFSLPGGGLGMVCTKRDTYPDGREFVGYGISPHVYVEPDVEDILNDRDVVLEKGLDVLKENLEEL